MKILWLAHRDPLNPRAGGAERTIYEVCTRLVRKGHNVILLAGGWKGSKAIENLHGIEIHRFGKNVAPHLALPVFLLKYHYDLIVNDLGHAVPWVFSTILNRHNVVFFRHLHARSLPGQVNPLIAKVITAIERCYFIIYHNEVFVTESTTSKSDLLKLGIREGRIVMNPPGVDINMFHPAAKTQHPTLVYFGGMRKYKRPQEILFLLKELVVRMKTVKLFIIGLGPEEPNLRKLASKLNLQDHAIFKGRISDKELSNIVASSWLNVHTSVTEGWGLSILEASAAGTPSVAYDVPGVRDAVEDGQNGIKVKDGNREALADAAFSIFNNPERWWSSSIEVANKYSWDKTVDMWERVIHEITNGHRKNRFS
jgi:glycosyltransferase involved in cell wall biosynthesis